MDDLDSLLIVKQEPWYMRMPQLVMEIRLISLEERYKITYKFENFLSRTKERFNSQFYSSIISRKDYNKRVGPKLSKSK